MGSWITRFIRLLLGARRISAVRAFISAVMIFKIALAVHAIHVDMVASLVEHHDADLHALVGGGLLAGVGDTLSGGQIDRGEILNLFGGFAADDELLRYVLSKRRAAKRDCAAGRQSQPNHPKFHFDLPDCGGTNLPGHDKRVTLTRDSITSNAQPEGRPRVSEKSLKKVLSAGT